MTKIVPMQSLYCSMQDENKICSFDIEVVTEPTTPLIHPMSRFWLINSGEATLMLNNHPYELKPGTLVSVLPLADYRYRGCEIPSAVFHPGILL